MSLTSNPLTRRLAIAAAGALVLAGGAGFAYATSLDDAVETGYATVVEGDPNPTRGAAEQDCPETRGGSNGSAAPSTAPEGSV